jgi:hypothetical protein
LSKSLILKGEMVLPAAGDFVLDSELDTLDANRCEMGRAEEVES